MKKIFTLFTAVLLTALLSGCADDDSFAIDNSASSGTNIPTNKNFVMLFDDVNPPVVTPNPIAGEPDLLDGGVSVQITITAGDRLKLATVGATAHLETEWGSLSARTCQIEATGSCTITWTSSANFNLLPANDQVAFTAWILGEEDFVDLDGDNIFNFGDFFDTTSVEDNPPGADLIGPYLDLNHDRLYTAGADTVLFPGNTNGVITARDLKYNGQNCAHPTLCGTATLIYISDHALLNIRAAAAAP